jgi:hypothetical protein
VEKRSVAGVERALPIWRDQKDLRVRDVFNDKGPGSDQTASLQDACNEEHPFATQQAEQAWPVVLRKVGRQPYRGRRHGASRQDRLTHPWRPEPGTRKATACPAEMSRTEPRGSTMTNNPDERASDARPIASQRRTPLLYVIAPLEGVIGRKMGRRPRNEPLR